eukprot:15476885-Alexandrium_andersonii.AAC.1
MCIRDSPRSLTHSLTHLPLARLARSLAHSLAKLGQHVAAPMSVIQQPATGGAVILGVFARRGMCDGARRSLGRLLSLASVGSARRARLSDWLTE